MDLHAIVNYPLGYTAADSHEIFTCVVGIQEQILVLWYVE